MFSVVNPCTGKLEWIQHDRDVTSETADISRELARSQYGDMLHDKQRNHLYQKGLEMAIAEMKASGREPHVLDIGTGTGLLAMMAAKAGAKKVTACEVLRPMVRIARQVISRNNFSDVISVVPKRSTEMTEEDMICRANILVTEVFDTELIGEGALVTFAHAHKHLLEPDSIVVPSSSRMFVQLIESDFLWQAHKLIPDRLPVRINVPKSWDDCFGSPSVRDCHVEQIKVPEQMKLLSDSTEVARFQFSDPTLSPDHSVPPVNLSVSASGRSHGLVVWWDMMLGDTPLSMEPWKYPQWRDHWLQAVYLWPQPIQVKQGEVVKVGLQHDDYSIWFSFETHGSVLLPVERPLCTCGVHTTCSYSRLCSYNDTQRTNLYLQVLSKVLVGKSMVVCVGDGCMWPLLLLLLGNADSTQRLPTHYYALSNSTHSNAIMRQLLEANNLTDSVTFLDKFHSQLTSEDFAAKPVDAIIGEPFFSCSLLPWHNIHYWYAVNSLWRFVSPSSAGGGGEGEGVLFPGKGSLMAIAVNFDNLYKLRAPVGYVEGFNLTAFDLAVGKHVMTPEGIEAEPHPLWEYPSYPRSDVHALLTFDFSKSVQDKDLLDVEGEMVLRERGGPCNGVVLWMEYALTKDVSVSTGLKRHGTSSDLGLGTSSEKLDWDLGFKQAVYFLAPKYINQSLIKLEYNIKFSSSTGNIDMFFFGVH